MVKVNTVVPGVNDQIIDDLSVRIRMIKPMNGNVAGALGGVNQTDIMNEISNHLVVCRRVVAMHNSSSAQVACCGSWTCDIVDMVSDVAHIRSIVVQAYTANRGQFKSHNVNVISVIVPGAMVHPVADDLRGPLHVRYISNSQRRRAVGSSGDVTPVRSGSHVNGC